MTPTRGPDSPEDHPSERKQPDPAAPVSLPQNPRTGRPRTVRRTLRRTGPSRPATVWLCAQDDHHEGTGLIATWLLNAVVKIVTTYTQPGQRVLLLAPAPFVTSSTTGPSTSARTRAERSSYAGLLEAAWTVVRLGRGIQTQAAGPPADEIDSNDTGPAAEAESGPKPHPPGPDPDNRFRPCPNTRPDPDRAATRPSPDRFELIVTAAELHTLDWLQPTAWADVLTPTGVLAVVTHSRYSRGRLNDPAERLVTAARHAGLRYHDRIALLRAPVRDGALAAADGDTSTSAPSPREQVRTAVRHTRVHDELLLFTRQSATVPGADGKETSDV